MDDHITTRKMGEVELADALIRLLDLAGRYNWGYRGMMVQHILINSVSSIGRQHFAINMALCDLGNAIYNKYHADQIEKRYSVVVETIMYCAHLNGYDIEGAMYEKLKYNETRADHKREAMAEEHGKKF